MVPELELERGVETMTLFQRWPLITGHCFMTSERWEEINRLYDAAVEVAEAERPSFLDRACGEDAELRREVESLLAYDRQAQPLLDRPALQVTAEKLASEPPSLVGRKLGPYQIQVLLGSGGMGEVYRARDTRLNRTVAIKVLPRHLLERTDLRQRFEREARAIASLDHPHICAVYDIGHEGTTDFLVMQYLDGETLSQRLRRGPLPTDEVLRHAIEIASALDKAHRQGVIHRDLKPGNIMLTETGAKLLDFGLAKQNRSPLTRGDYRGVESATKNESLTEQGMLLGTLEYMAPEQLEGKEADARTDIFGLSVVIYEMATGRKAFEGDSKASVIAKILTAQPPPITTIEPVTPPELDRVVQRCLAKKPEERWQSAAKLKSELQEIAQTALRTRSARKRETEPSSEAMHIEPASGPAAPAAISKPRRLASGVIRPRERKFAAAIILLAVIVGSFILWRLWPHLDTPRKEMLVKPLTSYTAENTVESAAIAPDGKYLAFCSNGKLFIQIMQTGEKRLLSLPEGFHAATVVWFPDETKLLVSRAEGKWTTARGPASWLPDRSLWSLSILGGTPQKIADHAEFPAGMPADGSSVSPDGSLVAFHVFNEAQGWVELWVVAANGESPLRVRAPSQADDGYFGPIWSPTGKRLFYIRDNSSARWIESCDLAGEHVTKIFPSKDGKRYFYGWDVLHSLCWVPDGRLLFSMQEKGGPFNLWEIQVDAATGQPLGEARRLTQWVGFQTVYADSLSITADGKQLVVLRGNLQGDVYIAEAEGNGKSMKNARRLTLDEKDEEIGGWTSDSKAVLFSSGRNRDNVDIFKQDIHQTDAETIIATPENDSHPTLSPDGAFILYLASQKSSALPSESSTEARLMRAPVGGGPPDLVLSGKKILNLSCASKANLCVVVEEVEGKQILTTFDPLKGRGEQLAMSDYPTFGRGILSPQGQILEKLQSGPDGLYIRVRSLPKGPVKAVRFKSLTSTYGFSGWSLDGRGMYLYTGAPLRGVCLYAGLNGEVRTLWKRGSGPGFWFDYPVPSPDGRYLAFTLGTYESNAWMLQTF